MHLCVCVHVLDLWIVPVLCDGKSPGFFHRSWVSKCVSYVFAEVWATSSSLSHAVFEEAGRNILKAVSQWSARAKGGAPLRKRLVEYQGFRSSTDFLIDTADCSLCSSIHFFHYFLFFLSSLTPFSSSIHLHSVFMLPPITTLMILNLTRFFLLWVHSTVYPSLHVGWKLWWYIILYCRCHVRRHVCSFGKEEEVVCTELQTKHQDVYSGTKGHHVSSDIILTAGSDTAFLVSLFFHWTRPHQPEFGDQLWDSFEVVTISLVGFCVYQVADIWYLVVLLNDLEYHRWSQVCKTTQVRVRFVPSLLAAVWSGCHNNLTNGIWTCVLCCLKCVNSKFKIS